MVTPFDKLPAIVSGPGDYATRDGRRVAIHEVRGPGTFAAKGSVYREFRGKLRPRGYKIWHVNGRVGIFGEVGCDIVGPWPTQAH
jgi:hypothetical protein